MYSLVALCLLELLGQALAASNGVNSTASNCTLYTVQSGDTCMSIAWANQVSYGQLITWNADIDSDCSNLASLEGQSICTSNPNGGDYKLANSSTSTAVTGPTKAAVIPKPTVSGSNADCGQWYLVESGQDCGTIETQFDISLDDFLFLNQEVWANCTNLQANVYYCVEAVGSISTYAGYGTTTTATQTFVPTNCTSLPWRNLMANYTTTKPVIPLANGTRTDCYRYLVLSSMYYENNTAKNCWSAAMAWDVPLADFVLWNPSLDQNYTASSTALVTATASSGYTYPCTLSSSMSYCILLSSPTPAAAANITAPDPRAGGEAANCTQWGLVYNYTNCESFLSAYDLTIAELYEMNPSVGSDCSGLDVGTYYCVSWFAIGETPDDWGYQYPASAIATSTTQGNGITTPSPIQTGMVSDCNKFYDVKSGDGCYAIATSYGIALSNFYTWNPAVSSCTDLYPSYYVCVGVQTTATGTTTGTTTSKMSTTTTTSTRTTTSNSGITTPTPIQSNMVSNCDKFYDVQSGDGCYAIATSYSIALTDFYNWNPAVSSCTDLYPSYYVCVGTKATTTNTATATNGITTPTPIQTGMVSDCNKFYDVQSGDGCYAIATSYGIALTNFYQWNPAVSSCTDLYPNYYVCVGVETTGAAKRTVPAAGAATTTAGAVILPSAVQ